MEQRLPLSGLKVIELSAIVAAPMTARLLSDYGAEVLKIEAPGGDFLRTTGRTHEFPDTDDNNPLFDLCNSGKTIRTMNLKDADEKKEFMGLLAEADIFISNVRMQSLERMGIDYESVHKLYPKLIYAHFSGFGLKGDEKNKPGYDATAFWMRTGGAMDITTPGSFPVRASFAFGDIATASSLLSAILMAVIGREKTGKGTLVSTSLLQSGMWCNAVGIMNAQPQYGKKYPLEPNQPGNPLEHYYQCKDGKYIAIMQNDFDKDRALFAKLFDLPELFDDPDCATLILMHQAGKIPYMTEKMQKSVSRYTSEEWHELLSQNDIPHEIGRHFEDAYKDPQAIAMRIFDQVEYPGGVTTAIPRPPFDFSEYDRKPFQKAPALQKKN